MSGLSSLNKKELTKEASPLKDIGVMVGAALAVKGITGLTDKFTDLKEKNKFNGVIQFAKQKHPELKSVPQDKMMGWMDAFHTLSPKISVNKELGSTMLMTAHDYGGNIDMATAKMIADTGSNSGAQGHKDDVISYLKAGQSFTPKGR